MNAWVFLIGLVVVFGAWGLYAADEPTVNVQVTTRTSSAPADEVPRSRAHRPRRQPRSKTLPVVNVDVDTSTIHPGISPMPDNHNNPAVPNLRSGDHVPGTTGTSGQ